jgi:hypothetical protein
MELRDDGLEEDPKANDGIYTAFFDPMKAGVAGNFEIQVFFEVEDGKLGRHTCTKLIPVYVPRLKAPILTIRDIFSRRNRLWGYTIIGARVVHPDGTPATPGDGMTANMVLTQGARRVKSGDLPYYRRGGYYIWRFDLEQARVKPGKAKVMVQAKLRGVVAATASQSVLV